MKKENRDERFYGMLNSMIELAELLMRQVDDITNLLEETQWRRPDPEWINREVGHHRQRSLQVATHLKELREKAAVWAPTRRV